MTFFWGLEGAMGTAVRKDSGEVKGVGPFRDLGVVTFDGLKGLKKSWDFEAMFVAICLNCNASQNA